MSTDKQVLKLYHIQHNIGRAKYVVNYHDGVKVHRDGSEFYDCNVFSNKKVADKFIKSIISCGYVEGGYLGRYQRS